MRYELKMLEEISSTCPSPPNKAPGWSQALYSFIDTLSEGLLMFTVCQALIQATRYEND